MSELPGEGLRPVGNPSGIDNMSGEAEAYLCSQRDDLFTYTNFRVRSPRILLVVLSTVITLPSSERLRTSLVSMLPMGVSIMVRVTSRVPSQ